MGKLRKISRGLKTINLNSSSPIQPLTEKRYQYSSQISYDEEDLEQMGELGQVLASSNAPVTHWFPDGPDGPEIVIRRHAD